jgi:hypothetical protein
VGWLTENSPDFRNPSVPDFQFGGGPHRRLVQIVEDLVAEARRDPRIVREAHHRVRLPRGALPVGQDAGVAAPLDRPADHALDGAEHLNGNKQDGNRGQWKNNGAVRTSSCVEFWWKQKSKVNLLMRSRLSPAVCTWGLKLDQRSASN